MYDIRCLYAKCAGQNLADGRSTYDQSWQSSPPPKKTGRPTKVQKLAVAQPLLAGKALPQCQGTVG